MAGSKWFTVEDCKIAFNLFCCVYGIGTLGMPANFARAGPVYASIALLFMACVNVYASVAVSRTMLAAPPTVKSYSDLGEWVYGTAGRRAVVVSQMAVCLLIPCAFLVLGGMLLRELLSGVVDMTQSSWIVVMAITVAPVCFIPTLKEGAHMALAGCLATVLSDVVATYVLVDGMHSVDGERPPPPTTSLHQVVTTFGNLSLAYGAAIVIPDLQHQHSQPERMPRIIGVTLTFISVLFLALASTGYSAAGCQISGNLLFSIANHRGGQDDRTTTLLGFTPSRAAVLSAFFFMQLHITIAFAVILHPAFYTFERLLLQQQTTKEYADLEEDVPNDGELQPHASVPLGGFQVPKYVVLRTGVVVSLVCLALALEEHFLELADFIGASCVSMCCLILPLLFYVRTMGDTISRYERAVALGIVVLSAFFGLYIVMVIAIDFAKRTASASSTPFPFCPSELLPTD